MTQNWYPNPNPIRKPSKASSIHRNFTQKRNFFTVFELCIIPKSCAMKKHLFLLLTFYTLGSSLSAQSFKGLLLDAETKAPIPYAAIEFGKEQGVITNEEGVFDFYIGAEVQKLDSIYISCLGYGRIGFSEKQLKNSRTIFINPNAWSLGEVTLTGSGLTADQIIERMRNKIAENYQQMPIKKKFFLRQSTQDDIERVELSLKDSSIEEIDQILLDSITYEIPSHSEYHAETLGDMYYHDGEVKLVVTKAAEIYDQQNQATFKGLNERIEKIIDRYALEDSYFKLKTGPISTKMQMDEVLMDEDEAYNNPIITDFMKKRKSRLGIIEKQIFGEKSTFDVVHQFKNYQFDLENIKSETGLERQYVIRFSPRGKAGVLEGFLYINTEDFALVRAEYTNVQPVKRFKLLGIEYEEDVYKGIAAYKKLKNGKYGLAFSRLEHHQFLNAERPLKIVEKNKNVSGRRQQNEINLELFYTGITRNIFEFVAFEQTGSSKAALQMAPENLEAKATHLPRYSPSFWEGFNILEPNKALQQFSVVSQKTVSR